MIVISGALVVIAIGLLVAGIVGATLLLIYASIGVSIVSALCLGVGVVVRRAELFAHDSTGSEITEPQPDSSPGPVPEPEPATVGAAAEAAPAAEAAKSSAKPRRTPAARTERPSPSSASAAAVPGDTGVFVGQGRRRYHLATCRQLAGRSPAELAYAEAREQGYTACTACMPDTALAARARPVGEAGHGSPAPDPFTPAEDAQPDGDASPASATPGEADAEEADPGESGGSSTSADGGGEPGTSADVRVVAGRKRFHRGDCAVVKDAEDDGVDVEAIGRVAAVRDGCTPCTICRP